MNEASEAVHNIDNEENDVRITSAGKEYLDRAVDLIARNFQHDPALKFILSGLPEPERVAYLPHFIHCIIKAAALNRGMFQEAKVMENDWSCCAVWMPPGQSPGNPWTMIQAGILSCLWKVGIKGVKRMLVDFQQQTDTCKRNGLIDTAGKPINRYYYLYFIATEVEARGKGLASHVIGKMQVRARKEGLPIWLEATTAKSRDIYARQGFEVVQELRLGKGTHAATGTIASAGEESPGVPLWAMIWHPKKETTQD